MKTLTTVLIALVLCGSGFVTFAAPARERASKQIKGKDYEADLAVLEKSQELALTLGRDALGKIKDPEDFKKMSRAVELIGEAKDLLAEAKTRRGKLNEVIRRQEEAFQILLELASREKKITKGQPKPGQAKNQPQEMNDLELKMKENKYEGRRLAAPDEEQNEEQKELLQALNRLRELARRQSDINERLKQLQTQLQAADDEQEKEELRRQLKRLLDEQKRVLEDMDELDQRMQRPDNESRMADARKELQEARNAAQKAAKSMEQERVSQAAAAGARSEETLKEMQDEFRKKTAGRFSEDMRRMREEVRDLNRRQAELNEQLAGEGEKQRQSLEAESGDEKMAEELRQQNQRLAELLQHAEQISRQTEVAEPVLHRQLYDSIRSQTQREARNIAETTDELQRNRIMTSSIYRKLQEAGDPNQPKSLDIAAELAGIGMKKPARSIGDRTGAGLDELQREIEKAAESVLGDESEALQRARREVNELARRLGEELARARGSEMQTNRLAMAGGKGQQPQQGQQGQEGKGEQPGEGKKDGGQSGREGKGQESKKGKGQGQGEGQGQSDQPGQGKGQQGKGQQGEGEGQQGKGGQGQGEGQPGQGQQGQGRGDQPGGQRMAQGQGGGRAAGPGEGADRPARETRLQPGTQRSSESGSGGFSNILPGEAGVIAERNGQNAGPITGEGFAEWADRMRNVEEMVSTDEMRNRLGAVRERVRSMRIDYKRHSKEPEWQLLNESVMSPLVEIRDQIANELARLNSREAIVPIDRDPVPDRFADLVRRYYETLGSNAKN